MVLIPSDNVKDLVEIPDNIKDKLEIKAVKWIDEVLELALERSPLVQGVVEREADGAPSSPVAVTPPRASRRSRKSGSAPAH